MNQLINFATIVEKNYKRGLYIMDLEQAKIEVKELREKLEYYAKLY